MVRSMAEAQIDVKNTIDQLFLGWTVGRCKDYVCRYGASRVSDESGLAVGGG